MDEVGAIKYEVTPINKNATISYEPYLDSGVTNEDSNWDDQFWNTLIGHSQGDSAFIEAHTMKTEFQYLYDDAVSLCGRKLRFRESVEKSSYQGCR